MERLSYIDTYAIDIDAGVEDSWRALLGIVRSMTGERAPWPVEHVLAARPSSRSGDWRGTVAVGDTIPGFAVEEVRAARHLALAGHHRFARYELTFELEAVAPERTRLAAVTHAEFPGVRGRIYRALVIGSGGHRVVARRLLRRVRSRAALAG
jgi:hypothetical protein